MKKKKKKKKSKKKSQYQCINKEEAKQLFNFLGLIVHVMIQLYIIKSIIVMHFTSNKSPIMHDNKHTIMLFD